MASLVKSVMLKIVADDGDSEAKLDKITAKAEELGRLHPDLQVKVDSAAASAKLAVLRTELKSTANAADGDSGSLKSRLMGLGGAASSIVGVGDAMTAASGDASMFQRVMAGASLATGLLEPALAGVVVAAGGMASGLVAGGIGLAAFGAVAKANLTTASTAATAVQAAQTTYNSAIATGTKQSTAYAAEQKAILTAYAQLSPAQIQLSKQISNAQNSWQSFVQSNTTGVSQILTQGIGLLPKVFQLLQPFITSTEAGLGDLMAKLKGGLDSGWVASFAQVMGTFSGPAISMLGTAIGNIVKGIAGVLQAFVPMGVTVMTGLDSITAKFATWGQTITSHTGFQSLMSMAQTEAPMAIGVLKNLATVLLNVGKAMTGMDGVGNSKMLLQVLQPLSGVLASLSKNQDLDRIALYLLAGADAGKKLKSAFSGISTGLQGLDKGVGLLGKFGGAAEDAGRGAKIASAATKVWTGVQAGLDVVLSMNPIGLIVIAIAVLVTAIVLLTLHCKSFRDFWKDTWKVIDSDAMAAYASLRGMLHNLAADTDAMRETFVTVGHDVEATWNTMVHALSADTDSMREDLVNFGHGVESVVNSVVGWFQALPGRIMGAISGLAGQMFSFGGHIISMLASGIESEIGSVVGAIGNVASSILDHIPHSPAKKGPLSGSGSPDVAGRKISSMLAMGIESGTPGVAASAHKMAAAATITGGAAGAASMASAVNGMSLQVQGGGGSQFNQFMATWIKNYVRVNFGGNVQKAFGH